MPPTLSVHPVSGALGAEVEGVDLAAGLEDATFEALHRAFLDHGALLFRDQKLPPERQIAFARRFGELDVHPIVEGLQDFPELVRVHKPAGASASFGVGWHSDNSFFERPSLGSVLYGVTIPPYGGDTVYSSMERAYEALSPSMRAFLSGLRGVHCAAKAYAPSVTGSSKYEGDAPFTYRWSEEVEREVEHPVVRTHPETGRKSLYVNEMFTTRIAELEEGESRALLSFLFGHVARPEFHCRFRWSPGAVAMWDNRCVQHYALDDYRDFERLMFRVTIQGDVPR